MTTDVRPEAAAGDQPRVAPRQIGDEPRGASWRASWRVALRMARRDVRRHRGRSLVVLLMVGLPAMLLVAALTLSATSTVEGPEIIPGELGAAQASVMLPLPDQVSQGANPTMGSGPTSRAARAIPGYDADADPRTNAAAIGRLTDATALPWSSGQVQVRLGDRTRSLSSFVVTDPSRLGDKVVLRSGRWPTGPDEVLLSERAVADGAPASGLVDVVGGNDPSEPVAGDVPPSGTVDVVGGQGQAVKVVGTVRATGAYGQRYALVSTTPLFAEPYEEGWLLLRDTPMPWSEVTELNGYGLAVLSAEVLRHPPSADQLPPELQQWEDFASSRQSMAVALAGVLMVIITTLLIGPAFAVSAARQRRTLALAAANGATTGQLRRTVLAQALVLGGLSAVLASAAGIALAYAFVRYAEPREWLSAGPFDVPWGQVGLIVAVAVVSSVLAALLPAARLGRLDVVGVMRGQHTAGRPSRWLPVAGLALAAAGSAAILSGARSLGTEVQISLGAVALVLGALMTVPTVLHLLGRLGSRLPLPLRLATRDLARHRARSAPTIAAVLAGAAALTAGLVGVSSDTEQARREYQPQTIIGEAIVQGLGPEGSDDAALERYRSTLPGAVVLRAEQVAAGVGTADPAPGDELEEVASPYLTVLPKGCTPEQTYRATEEDPADGVPSDGGGGPLPCQAIGDSSITNRSVVFLPADEIIRRMELAGSEADRVRQGGGVVLARATDRGVVVEGKVTLLSGTMTGDPYDGGRLTGTSRTSLPVVVRAADLDTIPRGLGAGLLLPTSVGEQHEWPLTTHTVLVRAASGPLTETQGERLQTAVGDAGYVHVERGFVDPMRIVTAVLLGLFTVLLLVITLTSAGLSLAEQENDQATLAAVGADRRTRRLMAGAQSFALAVVGVLLGVAVGLVPGIAITYPLTAMSFDPATGESRTGEGVLVIPWVSLLVMTLVVPLVAGALASLAVRRSPTATRRTT